MKKNDDDESDVDVHMICYIPCRIGDGSRVGIAGERRIWCDGQSQDAFQLHLKKKRQEEEKLKN